MKKTMLIFMLCMGFLITGCSCKMNKHYPVPECSFGFEKGDKK